jgi:hypothetical protein
MEPTHFLNVDLDIAGPARALAALTAELERRLFVLHADTVRGVTRAHYELRGRTSTVERTLRALLDVIEGLAPAARRAWRAARERDFNVGLQAGRTPNAVEYEVTAGTLRRVAAAKGRLVLTVYAPFPRPRIVGGRPRVSAALRATKPFTPYRLA